MDYENNVKLAALQTIRETVGDETFNTIMDKAIEVSEAGIADEVNAIRFAAADAVDEATCDIIDAIIDESTKAATVGTNMAKGAVNGAIKSGAWGAAFGATSLNPEVRKAKKELKDAENDGNDKKIAKAEEKLRSARIAGAKKGAISSAKSGAIVGAVGGGLTGAEKYKETHTGEHDEPIIDVKNYANKKRRVMKETVDYTNESYIDGVKRYEKGDSAEKFLHGVDGTGHKGATFGKSMTRQPAPKYRGVPDDFMKAVMKRRSLKNGNTNPVHESAGVMVSIWGSEEQFGG